MDLFNSTDIRGALRAAKEAAHGIAAEEPRIAALRGTADRGKDVASSEEAAMTVLDDYLVDPKLSLVDKTRIQAQVLVPVLQALRSELGKAKRKFSDQKGAVSFVMVDRIPTM